jgi:NAD(P)H-dependent FMN reductase|tara:strand:- start:8763 stop:9278 length:516 start_codon:yes stop_codon:yes gene_type:complete
MKTIIISSSLSNKSKSFLLCQKVHKELQKKKIQSEIIDARNIELNPCHLPKSVSMLEATSKIKNADNIIIGMGIHNYSISDSLKIILDTCFEDVEGKFFGIVCSAGGEKSYLATMHLNQMCMNQWKMIQLPRIVFATGKDFDKNKIISKDLIKWIELFTSEFIDIGEKLKN